MGVYGLWLDFICACVSFLKKKNQNIFLWVPKKKNCPQQNQNDTGNKHHLKIQTESENILYFHRKIIHHIIVCLLLQ